MSRGTSKGWGFKIDYDKAISQDEAQIRWAERSLAHGWYRRSLPSPDGTYVHDVTQLWELVLYFREVATELGYSAQDIADFAAHIDVDIWKRFPELPDHRQGRAGYDRGKAILAEVEALSEGGGWLRSDEADAKAALKKAKASRARHRRNQDKYGPARRAS